MAVVLCCVVFGAAAHTAEVGGRYLGEPAWALVALLAAALVCWSAWSNVSDRGPMAPVWHFLGSMFYLGLLVWYAPGLAGLAAGMPDMAELGYGLVLWAGSPVAVTGAPLWRWAWLRRG